MEYEQADIVHLRALNTKYEELTSELNEAITVSFKAKLQETILKNKVAVSLEAIRSEKQIFSAIRR